MSVIPVLVGAGTVFLDGRAHKTIYDGCAAARGHGATIERFRHNDRDQLEELLRSNWERPGLVAIDGVNSMTGNAPDLAAFAALAREHDALLYVDDAHGFGVIGERTPDEPSPTGGAATPSSATSARPTTTSCSSAASPRPTPRSWPSWPARRRSRRS
jgi:8-amino-7-oxononanoate synthase